MNLFIQPGGVIRGLYGEELDMRTLGRQAIHRASMVEPDPNGSWIADLSPVGGPQLGPFETRSDALSAEIAWLEQRLEKSLL